MWTIILLCLGDDQSLWIWIIIKLANYSRGLRKREDKLPAPAVYGNFRSYGEQTEKFPFNDKIFSAEKFPFMQDLVLGLSVSWYGNFPYCANSVDCCRAQERLLTKVVFGLFWQKIALWKIVKSKKELCWVRLITNIKKE